MRFSVILRISFISSTNDISRIVKHNCSNWVISLFHCLQCFSISKSHIFIHIYLPKMFAENFQISVHNHLAV